MPLNNFPYEDARDYHLKVFTNEIARRMFVATADGNYILARSAFFLGLPYDFYWLSVHALEKYYKAILLMNGKSARSGKHDIVVLHKMVRQLESRLKIEKLLDPRIEHLSWRNESFDAFLERFNRFGSPHNRYALYGEYILPDDIFKIDQQIWAVRRCCRAFHLKIKYPNGQIIEDDSVQRLLGDSRDWRVNRSLLEELVDAPVNDLDRVAFLRLNIPFAPDGQHELTSRTDMSHSPPLAEWFQRLRASTTDPKIQNSADQVLRWVRSNIYLEKKDSQKIKQALDEYEAAQASSQ